VPINLTGAALQWGLLDANNKEVIASASVQITIVDALNGLIEVTVPTGVTATVAVGDYTDALRINAPFVATMWVGPIIVKPPALPLG